MDTELIDMDLNNLLISWKIPHLYNMLHGKFIFLFLIIKNKKKFILQKIA